MYVSSVVLNIFVETRRLYIIFQEHLKPLWTPWPPLGQINLNTVANQQRVCSHLKKRHECSSNGICCYSKYNCHEYRFVDLWFEGLDFGNKHIPNDTTHRNNKRLPQANEEFCSVMADSKLPCTPNYQVERLSCRCTKVLSRDCHHNVGVVSEESN